RLVVWIKQRLCASRGFLDQKNLFLVAHESGHMFVYNKEHPAGRWGTSTVCTNENMGPGYAIHSGKSKTTRQPSYV
ncbi:WD repeat-containing protein 20, partial [Desmophyllum pertusum]